MDGERSSERHDKRMRIERQDGREEGQAEIDREKNGWCILCHQLLRISVRSVINIRA